MTLHDIWKQATEDGYAAVLDEGVIMARLRYGIKIKMDTETGEVRIFNTTTGGDAYREITANEYELFEHHGWRHACHKIALDEYEERLVSAKSMLDKALGVGLSKKRIHALESSVQTITERINSLKSKLYGEHI